MLLCFFTKGRPKAKRSGVLLFFVIMNCACPVPGTKMYITNFGRVKFFRCIRCPKKSTSQNWPLLFSKITKELRI